MTQKGNVCEEYRELVVKYMQSCTERDQNYLSEMYVGEEVRSDGGFADVLFVAHFTPKTTIVLRRHLPQPQSRVQPFLG